MSRARIVPLMALVGAAIIAGGTPAVAAGGATVAGNGTCNAAAAATALRLTETTPAGAAERYRVKPEAGKGTMTVAGSTLASGSCAAAITAFILDNIYMADGTVLARSGTDFVEAPAAATLAKQAIMPGGAHPMVTDGEFVMAHRVGYRRKDGQLITDYIGLWRDRGGSSLKAFSKLPAGDFTTPQPVATLPGAARSITYFPAPDTSSGTIGLVEPKSDGTSELVRLQWSHPGVFG